MLACRGKGCLRLLLGGEGLEEVRDDVRAVARVRVRDDLGREAGEGADLLRDVLLQAEEVRLVVVEGDDVREGGLREVDLKELVQEREGLRERDGALPVRGVRLVLEHLQRGVQHGAVRAPQRVLEAVEAGADGEAPEEQQRERAGDGDHGDDGLDEVALRLALALQAEEHHAAADQQNQVHDEQDEPEQRTPGELALEVVQDPLVRLLVSEPVLREPLQQRELLLARERIEDTHLLIEGLLLGLGQLAGSRKALRALAVVRALERLQVILQRGVARGVKVLLLRMCQEGEWKLV